MQLAIVTSLLNNFLYSARHVPLPSGIWDINHQHAQYIAHYWN